MTAKYLLFFLIFSISLELLDLVFRGYTAVRSWDILEKCIYGKDFTNIFILQYTLGNLVPFILLLIPGLTIRRAILALVLVIFGVFMMRWNVVIGGQSFSLTFSGYMDYLLPIIPPVWRPLKRASSALFSSERCPSSSSGFSARSFPSSRRRSLIEANDETRKGHETKTLIPIKLHDRYELM